MPKTCDEHCSLLPAALDVNKDQERTNVLGYHLRLKKRQVETLKLTALIDEPDIIHHADAYLNIWQEKHHELFIFIIRVFEYPMRLNCFDSVVV